MVIQGVDCESRAVIRLQYINKAKGFKAVLDVPVVGLKELDLCNWVRGKLFKEPLPEKDEKYEAMMQARWRLEQEPKKGRKGG